MSATPSAQRLCVWARYVICTNGLGLAWFLNTVWKYVRMVYVVEGVLVIGDRSIASHDLRVPDERESKKAISFWRARRSSALIATARAAKSRFFSP